VIEEPGNEREVIRNKRAGGEFACEMNILRKLIDCLRNEFARRGNESSTFSEF